MAWYNSLWLWRWLLHRLSKRQSLSKTTVLFRTTFTPTIKLNLLLIPLFAKLLLTLQLPFIKSLLHLSWWNTVLWGPVEYPFSDGYARLRNCIGRAHVSCTWRSCSMRELLPRLATYQYCGAYSPEELLHNLKWVVQALSECNLKLSAFQDFYQPQIYHDVWLEPSKPSSIKLQL